jgi:nitroimidazol reductase NimA-like FMN-containing flavoprotein (pyridoxamine 5'-phosphate oxidase superfamily)
VSVNGDWVMTGPEGPSLRRAAARECAADMPFLMDQDAGAGFEALTEEECFKHLEHRSIGRVAISVAGIPAVFPVNYQVVDGVIYFTSGEGIKLQAANRMDVVTFQIDEFDTCYHHGWSVLAVGTARVVDDPQLVDDVRRSGLRPWAPGHRDSVIQIKPEFVSGRHITFHPTS